MKIILQLKFLLVAEQQITNLKELTMTNSNLFIELSQKEEAVVSGGSGHPIKKPYKKRFPKKPYGVVKQRFGRIGQGTGDQYADRGGKITGRTGSNKIGANS